MRKRKGPRKRKMSDRQRKARLRTISDKLATAISKANRRGYTAMIGSKGTAFDDPRVKVLHKEYERLLQG